MVAPQLYLSARADNYQPLEPEAAQPMKFTLESFPVVARTAADNVKSQII
jgi:hypothetical protein